MGVAGSDMVIGMSSNALESFNLKSADVDRLLEIHTDLSGDSVGRKHGVEVLNRSGIVLLVAAWESFCEDLAKEGLGHQLNYANDANDLPKKLRQLIAKELREDKDELALWRVAGSAWKPYLVQRAEVICDERAYAWNTPKAGAVSQLFVDTMGFDTLRDSWKWAGVSQKRASEKLNELVTLRGDIAHRAEKTVSKATLTGHLKHVRRLVSASDAAVCTYVTKQTGTAPWT